MLSPVVGSAAPVTLWWPIGKNGEVLVISPLPLGQRLQLTLPPRFGRLLYVLLGAREEDLRRADHPHIGWRSRPEILLSIEAISEFPLSLPALAKYASQIERAIAKEVARLAPGATLSLLERRPRRGMRLAEGLSFVRKEGPWLDSGSGAGAN